MRRVKIRIFLLVAIAVVFASGSIGAAYACYWPPYFPHYLPAPVPSISLKICDQDEAWANGVRATWTANNMVPGDEFNFDGCFIGLSNNFPRNVDRGELGITCRYDSRTFAQPDKMAGYMVITRCIYTYTRDKQTWQIDLLTGRADKVSGKGRGQTLADRDWRILDFDRDGKITFFDLKKRPLANLPSYPGDDARFEMSVRFDQAAGNEFQGDTFALTMIYTLTAW
jgi:hypothetical protein